MLASSVAGLKAGTREHDLKLGGFLGGSNKGSRPWRKSHCTLKKTKVPGVADPTFLSCDLAEGPVVECAGHPRIRGNDFPGHEPPFRPG